MSQHPPRPLDELRLSEEAAQRLIARAVELDAQSNAVSVSQLRRAADEAGISPVAFEAALRELAEEPTPRPAAPVAAAAPARRPLPRRAIAGLVAATVLATGILVSRIVPVQESPARTITTEVVQVEGRPALAPTPVVDVEVEPVPVRARRTRAVPTPAAPPAPPAPAPAPPSAAPPAVPPAR